MVVYNKTLTTNAPSWVALAVLTQPHGVSGRIKVKSFTDPADDFATHKNLTDETGKPYKIKVTGHTQGLTIIEIEGITKREQAELLRGKKLGVPRETLPELKNNNQFYTDDLIGMEVFAESGAHFGFVTHVANYGAGDILDIRRDNGKSEMYGFTHATFPVVDVEARRITICPPDILGSKQEEPAEET
jgi:16S rRNA processing protein RimM